MIEHTRKEIEDDGCLTCNDVVLMNSVLATLDDAASEIQDARRSLTKARLYGFSTDFDLDHQADALVGLMKKLERDACPCGEPLDKHATEPSTVGFDREKRQGL